MLECVCAAVHLVVVVVVVVVCFSLVIMSVSGSDGIDDDCCSYLT